VVRDRVQKDHTRDGEEIEYRASTPCTHSAVHFPTGTKRIPSANWSVDGQNADFPPNREWHGQKVEIRTPHSGDYA
jgi:hypothetical protein